MAKRILVTGGTGTLGRAVAERLAAQGHEVRAVSRHAPADGRPDSVTWMDTTGDTKAPPAPRTR